MSVLHMRSPNDRAIRKAAAAAILLAGLSAFSAPVHTQEAAVWAITNARIVPVSSPAMEKGTIIIRNGIIEAIGASITIPGDARVLDAAGMTVYPGFIDALSDVGIEEARPQAQAAQRPVATPAVPARPGAPAQQQPESEPTEESRGLTPYKQAADMISSTHRKIESARNAGITTALVAPRTGFFPGQSSVINLSGRAAGHTVIKTPVAYHINMAQARGLGRGYPSSQMGVIAHIKQTLMDAQRYEAVWNQYRTTPGVPRPEYSPALEGLQAALKRQLPVVIGGDTSVEIERALALAEEWNLNPVIAGGMEAAPVAALLKRKNVPVLLAVKFVERERDGDPDAREDFESLKRRVEAPANAAALAGAGVRFAFVSDDMANPRDFIRNVGKAVEAGLDRQTALRALTMIPAEILGIADHFGSIEKNKTANLVLTTGDIFAAGTRVKHVFVDGQRFEIPEPEAAAGGGAAPPRALDVSGTWNVALTTPQGAMDITLAVRQDGSSISGTISSMMGTSEIYEGTVAGNRMSFKISVAPPGMGGAVEVVFSGTIEGAQISGTASIGEMGSMAFTGTRAPGEH